MKFKICIIGCGYISRVGHGPAVVKYTEENKDVILAGCCTRHMESALEFRDGFGFANAYSDYIEMLDKENPDAVIVATSIPSLYQVSIEVIKRGIPVLIEKPAGENVSEIKSIAELAFQNNVPVRVMVNRRYMPLIQMLKKEIDSAQLPILNINFEFIRFDGFDRDFPTTTIHGTDTIKYIASSDYAKAKFSYQDVQRNGKVYTNIFMNSVMENGTVAQMSFVQTGGCVIERYTVFLAGRTIFLETPVWNGFDSPGRLVITENGQTIKYVSGDNEMLSNTMFESNGFYDESASFFDILRRGEKPDSNIHELITPIEISSHIREKKDTFILL